MSQSRFYFDTEEHIECHRVDVIECGKLRTATDIRTTKRTITDRRSDYSW